MAKEKLEEVFDVSALKVLNNAEVKITDLNENFGNVVITGKVIHLFDQTHEAILQAGLVGDETGITRFVIWKTNDKQKKLEIGKVYTLADYKVNSYKEKLSIASDRNSTTTEKDLEIAVYEESSDTTAVTCFVVEVKKAAITKLCADPLEQDCKKKNKWGFDVRMILDSGVSTMTVDVRDFALLNLTVDKVKQTVMESGDPSLLLKVISEELSGRYLQIEREYEAQRYFLITNEQLLKMVK